MSCYNFPSLLQKSLYLHVQRTFFPILNTLPKSLSQRTLFAILHAKNAKARRTQSCCMQSARESTTLRLHTLLIAIIVSSMLCRQVTSYTSRFRRRRQGTFRVSRQCRQCLLHRRLQHQNCRN